MRACTCGKEGNTQLDDHAADCEYKLDWERTKAEAIMIEPFKHAFCAMHGEPLRAAWPKGYPIFTVKAFQELVGRKDLADEARRLHNLGPDENVRPKQLEEVFIVKQMCCRLSPKRMAELYADMQIGTMRRCRLCNRKRLGTEIRSVNLGTLSHVCFDCFTTRFTGHWTSN